MFEIKQTFYVVLCRKIHNIYHVLKKIKLKSETQEKVRYKKSTYSIELTIPTYTAKMSTFYYMDIDDMSILTFKEIKSALSPKDLDILVSRNFVSGIASDLNENTFSIEMKNLFLGIFLGAFGAIGIILILMQVGIL